MKPILYCDIDSTVNDHWRRIQRNSRDGVILPSAFTAEEIRQDVPLPGAREALQRFAEDWDVHFLSARHWRDALAVTIDWLQSNGFPFKTVNLVESHHDKLAFLRTHPCDLYIDDFAHGQEFSPPPCRLHHDIIEAMPCPYERFRTEDPQEWERIAAKYFQRLPNGEVFWQFMRRNLDWWRASREHERTSRARFYRNFADAVRLQQLDNVVAGEIGAGPFGGLLQWLGGNPRERVFIDILANSQRVLRFIDWPNNAVFVECPAEKIALPDKSVDVLVSYNALDHGWDVLKCLDEVARVSKECYLAFDCKANGAPPHDRLDHYQIVEFPVVTNHLDRMMDAGKVSWLEMGDLRERTPHFHFDHNWGFPVFYCHAKFTNPGLQHAN